MDKQHHSRSYHRFFEDWAEQQILDESGKIRITRVYIGKYYLNAYSSARRILQKILYAVLYLLSVTCFIFSGIQYTPVNMAVVPSAAAAICTFALAFLAFPVFYHLISPAEMIIRQYRRASLELISKSTVVASLLALAALIELVSIFFVADAPTVTTLLCALGYFLSAAFSFSLRLLEKRTPYAVLPPRVERPENSTVIQYESNF